jgi:hypothetical protein
MEKAIQNALAQQKTENQALIKKVTELQTQMAQQAPATQIVEPVRQPKGPPSSLQTKEGRKDYYITEFLKDLGFVSKGEFDRDYSVKNFQRSRSQQNNNSVRFDRIEEGLEETQNNVNQLADLFQKKAYIRKCGICGETGHSKGSCPKRPVAQSNFTRSYFTPLTPIVPPDSDEENGDNNEEEDRWYDLLVKKNR